MKIKGNKFLLKTFIIILIISCGILLQNNLNKKNNNCIDELLTQPEYSYLSSNAKEYIKKVYEEKGEAVLTEKNKNL